MIYLDNAATTPISPKVLEAMMPYLTDHFGNAGSIHFIGREAKQAIEKARKQVADFIEAKPEQIIFTSGGTEANNLAILGVKDYLLQIGKTHIVTTPIEHKSVLNAIEALKKPLCQNNEKCIKDEFYTSFLKVDRYGMVSINELINIILNNHKNIGLISVMHTNNEIGVVNDVASIGECCRDSGILFHTDCVQAAGCNKINVDRIKCDLMSISSHKIHGPKGVGALYVRDRKIMSAIINGGSEQEFGLRGGTENVADIVGFGMACKIAGERVNECLKTTSYLCELFVSRLCKKFIEENIKIQPSFNHLWHYPGKMISVTFKGVDAETLILMLDSRGVCVSAGSACQNHNSTPSHVLKAIGLSDEEARSTIRVSFSEFNTEEDVKYAVDVIYDSVKSLARCKI